LKAAASIIFRYRVHLLTILGALTLLLGYEALQIRVSTDFSKMVPQEHEYTSDYRPLKGLFGGGNQLEVSVSRGHGTILDPEFLKTLRKINEDVMFVKGVDRRSVKSIVTPETRVVLITQEGFELGSVVPDEIPETEAGLDQVGKNIQLGGFKGLLVSMDLRSALIYADIYETGVDYLSVYRQLNRIRDKYVSDDISVHINGFAMVVGFVNDALPKIVLLFGLSILITFLILYRCFRYVRLAVLPLFSGGLSVLYTLGIARLMGLSLDPMTAVIPFLVFAIGASHGIQMVKRYLEECAIHARGYDAALHSLAALMVPGTVALITDVIGFLTIIFVPIGVILELAMTAAVGVASIIVANTLVMTLILSFFSNLLPREIPAADDQTVPWVHRALLAIARLTYGRNAYRVAGLSLLLLLIGLFTARTMTVGDVNPGEPLLWEDSVYNRDAAKMMSDYMLGIDNMSVVLAGEAPGICKRHDILQVMQAYEREIGEIPGVTVVISALLIVRMVNETFHEGDIRWREVPMTPEELTLVMLHAGSGDDGVYMNMGCQQMNILIYLSDHKGDTIRRVVAKTQEFIQTHPMDGARFVLAGGNVGVMAATNEVVGRAQIPMMLLIYLSIFVLCLLIFRNLKAPLFILTPLLLVSVIATAFMKAVGLGLNVNTLPVAALGVGIGVDYGIYIYSRLSEERRRRNRYAEAVDETLLTTGAAVLYTALTLSAGVLTWLLSDLKFQADMGILLGFLFMANMIGAMVLLPALIYLFDNKGKATT